jgi:hypothetical protein
MQVIEGPDAARRHHQPAAVVEAEPLVDDGPAECKYKDARGGNLREQSGRGAAAVVLDGELAACTLALRGDAEQDGHHGRSHADSQEDAGLAR